MPSSLTRSAAFAAASLALCVLSVASACHRQSATGIFVDPAFGPLVPPDTTFLAGVRLDKVRETPLYKRLNGQFNIDQRLDLFSQRTGLDPRKDLWQILVASDGKDTLVMARGRFTTGEAEPELGKLGAVRTPYRDYTLLGSPQTSVVFLNPGVAVAGTQAALRKLIDRRNQHDQIPPAFASRLAKMPAADQLWLLDEGGLASLKALLPGRADVQSMLGNLVAFVDATSMGVHLDQGVQLSSEFACVSPEGAQRVRDAFKGVIGFARLGTPSDHLELLKLFDAIHVDQAANSVTVTADFPADLVDTAIKTLPSLHGDATRTLQSLRPH